MAGSLMLQRERKRVGEEVLGLFTPSFVMAAGRDCVLGSHREAGAGCDTQHSDTLPHRPFTPGESIGCLAGDSLL